MIVKILSAGKSFKGLGAYLTHDAGEKDKAERVAWTHTLNLANDHVPSAISEMLMTSRNAELLKQEAGIRAGGRVTENTVKHFSLNWAPDEKPTRDQMIDATQSFLGHMKWDEHQALLVAHQDKAHAHVHVMLNTVHPETGLKIDEGFERRRAQAWALAYEREHGRIYCEQRLMQPHEREDAPTREAWRAFEENKKSFEREEKSRLENNRISERDENNPKIANFAEWKMLREIQKRERLDYFAEGKSAFKELRLGIYREVREEFRPRWADYYAAEKNGTDGEKLTEIKADLLREQKTALEDRRDEACGDLRKSRDGQYRELLDAQAEMRRGLHGRQDAGLSSLSLLDHFKSDHLTQTNDVIHAFREAGRQTTAPRDDRRQPEPVSERLIAREPSGNVRTGPSIAANLGVGLALSVGSLFDSLADGLIAANPAPRQRQPEPDSKGSDLFTFAAEEARQKATRDKEIEDKKWFEERWTRSRE